MKRRIRFWIFCYRLKHATAKERAVVASDEMLGMLMDKYGK